MTTLRALVAAGLVVATFGMAVAKLPPPPPMDDKAKAAAEEKKAKDAAAAEAAKAQQAKAEDRVAARYIAEQKAKGKAVTPQMGPTAMAAGAHRRKARHRRRRAHRAGRKGRGTGEEVARVPCPRRAGESMAGAAAPVFPGRARPCPCPCSASDRAKSV